MTEEIFFSAGEVEKFGYCPLNWWLSRDLPDPEVQELTAGIGRHEEVSSEIKKIEMHEYKAQESERLVLYFAIGATIIAIAGLTFLPTFAIEYSRILVVVAIIWLLAALYFLYRAATIITTEERLLSERVMVVFSMVATVAASYALSTSLVKDRIMSEVVEAVALVWLIGASFFLYHSMREADIATLMKDKYGLGPERIIYVDHEASRPKLFVSRKYGLRGRPDLVLLDGESHVPVEMKSGRTPRGPLFSHILQMAAYCLLIEGEYGKPPPFGLIKYEGAQHEIEYNEDLKALLLAKLAEMRASARLGEVHRNHSRPGKCRNCSRRSICPERLA